MKAAEQLSAEGHQVQVVSLPSTDIFDAQDEAPARIGIAIERQRARVAVEAGIADYWYKYVGLKGAIVGMTGYGESAPADKLFPYFGFTVENVVAKAKSVLKNKRKGAPAFTVRWRVIAISQHLQCLAVLRGDDIFLLLIPERFFHQHIAAVLRVALHQRSGIILFLHIGVHRKRRNGFNPLPLLNVVDIHHPRWSTTPGR